MSIGLVLEDQIITDGESGLRGPGGVVTGISSRGEVPLLCGATDDDVFSGYCMRKCKQGYHAKDSLGIASSLRHLDLAG